MKNSKSLTRHFFVLSVVSLITFIVEMVVIYN